MLDTFKNYYWLAMLGTFRSKFKTATGQQYWTLSDQSSKQLLVSNTGHFQTKVQNTYWSTMLGTFKTCYWSPILGTFRPKFKTVTGQQYWALSDQSSKLLLVSNTGHLPKLLLVSNTGHFQIKVQNCYYSAKNWILESPIKSLLSHCMSVLCTQLLMYLGT